MRNDRKEAHPSGNTYKKFKSAYPGSKVFSLREKILRLVAYERARRVCVENVNLQHSVRDRVLNSNQLTQCSKVFAYGEDTLTLRLTSELVDLRVGYVNLQSTVNGLWTKFKSTAIQQQKEPPVESGSFCWQG